MTMKLSHASASEIESDIRTIERILSSRVIESTGNSSGFEDSLTRLLICLRDLLAKSSLYTGKHVNFNDDVIKSPAGAKKRVRNVMLLIEYMRDAVSHPDANNHLMTPNVKMTFGRVFGKKKGTLIMVNGEVLDPPCDYDDDIAIIFGYQRIYLKRHIIRAFEEAKANLEPIVSEFHREERERFVREHSK